MRDFTIGEVAGLIRPEDAPSPRMLKYWCDAGILRPAGGEGRGDHRRFSLTEVQFAILVARLASWGMNTHAITQIVATLRARIAQSNTSILELALETVRNGWPDPVELEFNRVGESDYFQVEDNPSFFGRTDTPDFLRVRLDRLFRHLVHGPQAALLKE